MIDQPLGLPCGSVRAIIFILLTIGVLLAPWAYNVEVKEWFFAVSGAWLLIIGHYFGERKAKRDSRRADDKPNIVFDMGSSSSNSNVESSSRSNRELLSGDEK